MSDWKQIIRTHLAPLRLPPERESEIVEELAQHLEAVYEDALRAGATDADACARALQTMTDGRVLECEIGRIERPLAARWLPPASNIEYLERRGGMRMENFWQDLRFGARMLGRNPGFALIAVLTLALGIGANTAIFSIVNAILLNPLPFREPERLMNVWTSDARSPIEQGRVSYLNFSDVRRQSQSFERLAAYRRTNFVLTGSGDPIRLPGATVSADLFGTLGVAPSRGRDFQANEEQPGAAAVVILSHGLWQRRFNSDPEVVGKTVTLDSRSFTIIGVMPAGFQFPIEARPVELWMTVAHDSTMPSQRGLNYLEVTGRLKPGVAPAQAQAELDTIAQSLERQYPDNNANQGLRLAPTRDQIVGDVRTPLLVIFGAVVCVLLIACANVANLLLARATARRHEMAVRAALGASRGRVIRQLLTESLLLSFAGGVCGLLLASWGARLLIALSPATLPRLHEIRVDGRVFGFTLLVSFLTGVLFGLAPALQGSRLELTETLKEGGRGAHEGTRRNRMRGALVIAEVAIALVLMVGAGLLLTSFWRLLRVDAGYDPRNVLTLRLDLPDNQYSDPLAVDFYERLQARLGTLPGVRAASASFSVPFGSGHIGTEMHIEGRTFAPTDLPQVDCHIITPDYFRVLGIRLTKGRDFTARDDLQGSPVVIINEALARRYFPNEEPLGKRVRPDIGSGSDDPPMREIIGVVADAKYRKLTAEVQPEVYFSYPQMTLTTGMTLVLRSDVDPRTLIDAVRREVQALDRELPLFDVKTLDQYFGMAVAHPRFNTLLLAIFACVALMLTAVGLYGLMSYSVAQRTHEIGIRCALGAKPRDVLRLVMRQGLGLVLIGVAAGLGAALALTRLISDLLFSVKPTDAATFFGVALLLTIVALLACYFPARRATKVDPLVALRSE